MEFKNPFKSKIFWTGLAGIFTSIGLLVAGEVSVTSFIIESVPGVLGILNIIFRINSDTKLGWR